MINGRIIHSYLGKIYDEEQSNVYIGVALAIKVGDKTYQIGPTPIQNTDTVLMILGIAEADYWEELVGKTLRVEVEDNKITKMMHITDDEIYADIVMPEKWIADGAENTEKKVED